MGRKRMTVQERKALKDSAIHRGECRDAAKQEPLTWACRSLCTRNGRAVRQSVYWRYWRRYGKAP